MVPRTSVRLPILMAVVLSAGALTLPAAATIPQTAQSSAPDNSAANKHQETTADKQSHSTTDRETTRRIRKAVIADKTLSLYAHNVKIVVESGAVTLQGPVRSEEEKKRVGDLAAQVTGDSSKVTNNLTVKSGS